MKKSSILKASTAPLALGLMLTAAPAFAQESVDDAADEEVSQPIVVTGSRIARPNITGSSPITVVGSEQIELTGTVTLETLLNDLPQVIPGNNRSSNNSGGEAFATLDLRGLGANRNLILVDGERLAASSTTGTVDISQIPNALIERIEVVTGGATAVYGSDAISGVINFVLRDDFEGVSISSQANVAEEGVGFNYNVQGLFGGNFDDGRGNLTVSASYFDRESVSQGRFDYSRVSAGLGLVNNVLTVIDDPINDLGAGDSLIFSGGSGTNPFGTVSNSPTNPFQNLDTISPNFASFDNDCDPSTPNTATPSGAISFTEGGDIRPNSTGGLCRVPVNGSRRFNFAPLNNLAIGFQRFNFASTGSYEFSDNTSAKIYASYTRTESVAELAPTPAGFSTAFTVNADSPLIPADLAAALATRPDPTAPFTYSRRFLETGPRIATTESEAFQIRTIIEQRLSDNLSANFVASFGRSELDQRGEGNINRTAVEQGLDNCVNAAGVQNGVGILPGCVAVDIFGINTLTPEMVSFVQTDTFDADTFEQIRLAANVTGSLFDLPAGPLGVAVGAEYRKDTGESIPDDAKRRGEIIGFNQANPLGGSISVKEVYGEVRIPLLGGDTGIVDSLALEGGARYSDYNLIGGLFNWKVGVELAPVNWLRFRAAYNKAARAPSVFELFQNGDQGFPSYTDPCNVSNAGRDDAFCVQQGVPAAALPTFDQTNSQVQAFAFGNPNLSEENAETYTIGAVLTPNFFPLGRVSLTVDYYNIEINDLNAAQGAQFFINDCFNNQTASSCARITRDGSGQITQVNTTRVNSDNALKTSGIDVGFNWSIGIDEIFGSGNGRITIDELFTWVDSYKIGNTDFVDTADAGLGGITSEFASTLTVGYQNEGFTGQVRWVYKSGGEQGGNLFGTDDQTGFTTPRVPDLNSVDLSLRYNFGGNFSLTGIVHNVFNELPPQTAVGIFEQANSNVSFYNPLLLGRNFTVQAQVRF